VKKFCLIYQNGLLLRVLYYKTLLSINNFKIIRWPDIKKDVENELIVKCQQGNLEAYKMIYEMHSTMLYSIAMRMLSSKEDAEDVLQNVFIRLFNNIKNFRFQAKFSSWLTRILINCCYDHLNKKKSNHQEIDENVLKVESQNDLSLSLEKSIGLLPLKMRECFILFAVEGFKQKEIADTMEISEGTVKAHISQAKAKLRKMLGEI